MDAPLPPPLHPPPCADPKGKSSSGLVSIESNTTGTPKPSSPLDLREQEDAYRAFESARQGRPLYGDSVYALKLLPLLQGRGPTDAKTKSDDTNANRTNQSQKRKRGGKNDHNDKETSKMNPKNLYSRPEYAPDFRDLAARYPVLLKHLEGGNSNVREATALTPTPTPTPTPTSTSSSSPAANLKFNFKSWEACRDLVSVQFEDDFGVRSWSLPRPHLIPPLANRLNYLCYVHDLLERDGRVGAGQDVARADDDATPGTRIQILDVGCGANIVYPLLAASYFRWRCVGCDVNGVALAHAAGIRDANPDISPLILLREASGLGALRDVPYVDASVCNPPFFDSDVGELAGQNPRTDYGGTRLEMWCSGGEEAFVLGLIRESKVYRDRCGWFSTMVGKKKTLRVATAALAGGQEGGEGGDEGEGEAEGAVTHRIRALEQGITTRWVLAWRWREREWERTDDGTTR